MTVKNLYEMMEKNENWAFYVCKDGDILAFCNSLYDFEGKNPYTYFGGHKFNVVDLFDETVKSFKISSGSLSLWVRI